MIITRLMPDTFYYGISDLTNTVISFCSSIAIMGMYDAMYRMVFEKEDNVYKNQICSTALLFTIFTSLLVSLLMVACKGLIATFVFGDSKCEYLVYITAIVILVSSTNSIVSAPTRMQNNKKSIFDFFNAILCINLSTTTDNKH